MKTHSALNIADAANISCSTNRIKSGANLYTKDHIPKNLIIRS